MINILNSSIYRVNGLVVCYVVSHVLRKDFKSASLFRGESPSFTPELSMQPNNCVALGEHNSSIYVLSVDFYILPIFSNRFDTDSSELTWRDPYYIYAQFFKIIQSGSDTLDTEMQLLSQ